MLEFCRFRKVIPGDDKERGKVDPSILIGLNLKALPVPIYGIVKALLVCVLRLHELILKREKESMGAVKGKKSVCEGRDAIQKGKKLGN